MMKREKELLPTMDLKKVLDNHTQKQRVEFIIEKYNEWKNSQ